MYQVMMIEDDDRAADDLTALIKRYGAERKIEFSVTRHATAIPLIKSHRSYDLVFMDIDLPGINGMEAAELLRTYDPTVPLIFVTNLAQYAVHGYQVDALDFIVKPVSYYHFSMRMDKAMRAIARNRREHVTVTTRGGVRVVPCAEIVYVETQAHDLIYRLVGDKGDEPLRVRGSLSALEEELGGAFLRISSGCIVNMDHIRAMQSGTLLMDNGDTLYASRAKKKAALETFADYLGGSI
ncbi:LytTR family DNA-binding domain-containing protein [Paratractidigestivibacter sp.]|uniref:LytR/AlgR family response regulator transcription factor n=1 Tax=Paratractidigestivibacter sp. TaxID=2847316 RepID=UPI002ABE918A|nr:LytTR family DNA-binding domain-containing protein [Paratractidigestivibacter sp.]